MRLSDRQIQDVITALGIQEGRVTGARLRAELARRFGARGGVTRVYRLMTEAREGRALQQTQALIVRLSELERDLAAATERATLAEHREEVHQARAANQIYALREQLLQAQESPRAQGVRHEDYLQIHRALAAARLRIAELEARAQPRE